MVNGGKYFFDLHLKLIGEAKHSIHLQTYAFAEDETGIQIADALKDAARRGVKVYLLADGYASQKLSKEFKDGLKEAGVHFRYFEPLLKSRNFYFGRRLHHKVTVFDSVRAIVGSKNIADRYNDTPGEKSWLDMTIYVEGETAMKLEAICWQFWLKKRYKLQPPHEALEYAEAIPEKERVQIRIRQNDWVMRKIEISRSYFALFSSAQKSIYIMCSYFLPGKKLLRQLKKAAARGVKIQVVLAGTSDVKTAKFAERYLYRWMFRHGISIYEYQPTVLHAKMCIVDSESMTIGSYNINGLSAYASIELNLDVKNERIAGKFEKQVKQIMADDCKVVKADDYVYHLFTPRQLLYWLSYQLMNLVLTVATFYYKQRE
jgi:cardiolipin synthase